MFEYWLALDPGSKNFRMYSYSKQKQIDLRSCVAYSQGKLLDTSKEALKYVYANQKGLQVKYPLKEGKVISPITPLIKRGLKEFNIFQSIYKPCVFVAVNEEVSDLQKQKWQEELVRSGIRRFEFVDTMSLLQSDEACFIIHAGHSYTEIGIYAYGQEFVHKIIHFSGSSIDDKIKMMIASKTNCLISDEDASALKEAVSNTYKQNKTSTLSCGAVDRYGKTVQIQISCNEIWPCIEEELKQIILWARECYMNMGVEMKSRLMKNGIRLSGGLSHCFGLVQGLKHAFDCPIICTNEPECDMIEQMKGLK